MARPRDRMHWCETGWFSHRFYFGFCPSPKVYEAEMQRLGVPAHDRRYPTTAGACTYLTNNDGKLTCIVTLMDTVDTCNTIQIVGVVAHEAVHVWQQLCDLIGEDSPSAEFEAHAIQAITEELLCAYKRSGRWRPEDTR